MKHIPITTPSNNPAKPVFTKILLYSLSLHPSNWRSLVFIHLLRNPITEQGPSDQMPLIVMPELDSLQELPYFYDGLELQHVGTIGLIDCGFL